MCSVDRLPAAAVERIEHHQPRDRALGRRGASFGAERHAQLVEELLRRDGALAIDDLSTGYRVCHEPAMNSSRLSYTRAVKPTLIIAALLLSAGTPAQAQPAEKIRLFVEARSEGQGSRDDVATRLFGAVRSGLEALSDVQRIIWIVVGRTPGAYAASVMITERYDRETLMVLGIEDDEMAGRMMALQIANDHQIFTGRDLSAVGRRIVTAVDEGVLAKLRATRPKR